MLTAMLRRIIKLPRMGTKSTVALAPIGARAAMAMKPRMLRRLFAVVQGGAGMLLIVGR
jgi:uncharacterized membrane protein YfcA